MPLKLQIAKFLSNNYIHALLAVYKGYLRYHINDLATYNNLHANTLYLEKSKTETKDDEPWCRGYKTFFMFNSHYMQFVLAIKFKLQRIVYILKPILKT